MKQSRPVICVVSSHVVRGSVGNRIMVPVLEALGFDVWALPTIVLPFHPGQGSGTRIVPDDRAFGTLLNNLASRNDLDRIKGIVTGYFGSARQVHAISQFIDDLRARTNLLFACDPVIGDTDGLYVSEEIATTIRDALVPKADLITPNRYEHDWLTGTHHDDNTPLTHWRSACAKLGVPQQVVTSVPQPGSGRVGNLLVRTDEETIHYCHHERLATVPNGTGDLFTASYVGLSLSDPVQCLERATSKVLRSLLVSESQGDLSLDGGFAMGSQDIMVQRIGQAAGARNETI